jgi:hypothetical protein
LLRQIIIAHASSIYNGFGREYILQDENSMIVGAG